METAGTDFIEDHLGGQKARDRLLAESELLLDGYVAFTERGSERPHWWPYFHSPPTNAVVPKAHRTTPEQQASGERRA
jgi:hypothetical protein